MRVQESRTRSWTTRSTLIWEIPAEVGHRKAILHAWLAWQSNPGCPYGTAITAHYFAHNAELAMRFVDWYARLFGLIAPAGP